MRSGRLAAFALGVVALACQAGDSSLGVASTGSDGLLSGSTLDTAGSRGTDGDEDPQFDLPGAAEDSFKLDVAAALDVGSGCTTSTCSCRAVDILFVVDNAPGLAETHAALAEAFVAFIEALAPAVDGMTSLHVGVTSTSMGHSRTRMSDGCAATGDRGAPAEAFYETPDTANNGLLAAQGRLNLADGMPFFSVRGGDDPLEPLHAWFAQAVSLPAGSQIEMAGAAAAWVGDPANHGVNAGFVRNGAVLLIVFVVADADQTPTAEVPDLVARLEAIKSECGGVSCIVAGALLPAACMGGALASMMDDLGGAHIAALGRAEGLGVEPLGAALAPLLGQACDPPG